MKFYFAPMEGLTGYIYRNAHNIYFNHVDKYFSPFIVASQRSFKTREWKDIMPENNQGISIIPQLLTNHADDFIHMSKNLKQLGYDEINLNLGCPSGTVVAKKRGAGFLSFRDELDVFLDEVFTASVTKISIKTRIGVDQSEEFYKIIKIFNKYPLKELIIHPRIQKDFYKNKPNLEIFKDALTLSKNPICYNGDIFTFKDYRTFINNFPEVDTIMIGRGLIINPGLVRDIKNNVKLDKNELKAFHNQIYEEYKNTLFGDRNILFKMKEIWVFMISVFSNNEKYAKKIKKATKLTDYEEAVASLFEEQTLLEE
ncbi:tRNA-dihydrouridine synthase family protein [Mobilitalea sibirica]|uniref:tRNA-dihydrouridine synthase n=1 Tax=Mobilitalea sibirica TaxID=1462919 RepID=A0A8J7H107_9FIRM|nr:tRNA-dihydrouridine synthase family protein [Mobilitalea sibirica]MBH1939928.1 tRNA-dihydrouridine synthase family protein [Mobilitalea sibirica]